MPFPKHPVTIHPSQIKAGATVNKVYSNLTNNRCQSLPFLSPVTIVAVTKVHYQNGDVHWHESNQYRTCCPVRLHSYRGERKMRLWENVNNRIRCESKQHKYRTVNSIVLLCILFNWRSLSSSSYCWLLFFKDFINAGITCWKTVLPRDL